ncbi:hypothetical protein [Marinivivus vitaminiproducens]|uniref:hypothetical protein n=1 Tax=Marinivivus vitaminiproducens TaxID=3035935 RepID=UPI0027A2EBE3|nr:hypothetical protein P4R82_08150 [Geminicoccaceae bacterium SCSIO 64248]
MATLAETAAHLDITTQRVNQLQQRGILPYGGRGGIDLDEARWRYLLYLQIRADQVDYERMYYETTRAAKRKVSQELVSEA